MSHLICPPATTNHDALFLPGCIGSLEVKNRLFVAAHTTNLGVKNRASEANVAYLEARAKGGAGLIITEGIRVAPDSVVRSGTLGGYDPRSTLGFGEMADAAHKHGVALFGQLLHIGHEGGGPLHVPAPNGVSTTDWAWGRPPAHEMTVDEVEDMAQAYGRASQHLVDAGFDGIEVHLGHGHLLHQFISPLWNKRGDYLGGKLKDRLRAVRWMLRAVLERAGNIPVGIRVSGSDFLEGGIDLEMSLEATRLLLEEFDLSFINVSHSAAIPAPTMSTQIADMSYPDAPFSDFPKAFKQEFDGPAILTACRYDDPDIAAEMVRSGGADFIGMARGNIADPNIIRKWQEGRPQAVTRCIACNTCIARTTASLPVRCTVNPAAGLEAAWAALRNEAALVPPRRVLVVGGGPGGLSAAVGAATLGHEVRLLEQEGHLGGMAAVAARLTGRDRIAFLVEDLIRRSIEAGVETFTGTRVEDHEQFEEFDEVIDARGALPRAFGIPSATEPLSPCALLQRESPPGARILIIDDDGGYASLGLAQHLAMQGRAVTIVVSGPVLGHRIPSSSLPGLMQRLKENRVARHVNARVVSLRDQLVLIRDDWSRAETELGPFDDIVYAHPGTARDPLRFAPRPPEGLSVTIGDAHSPRGLMQAVHAGFLRGSSIGVSNAQINLFLSERAS